MTGRVTKSNAPTRPLASSETLSVLDMMKDAAPGAVLSAISQPGGYEYDGALTDSNTRFAIVETNSWSWDANRRTSV